MNKNITPNEQSVAEYKKSGWKFTFGFVGLFLFVFTVVVSWKAFQLYAGQQAVERLAQKMAQEEQEMIEKRKADMFGGKTPQETLDLYIKAVEKGDYELASKYLIIEKQEEELRSLKTSDKSDIANAINLLKESLKSEGGFSTNKDGFSITKPVLVNFVLYPNQVWKIVEI